MPEAGGGFHPQTAPFSIQKDTGEQLLCQYFPEGATETLEAEWKDVKSPGTSMKTYQFMFGEPRKLSTKLLLNDWGNDPDRGSGTSVSSALAFLRSSVIPYNSSRNQLYGWGGGQEDNSLQGKPPPKLTVALTDTVFIGHLKSATITYLKLSPQKVPIRAEVDVEFIEYVPQEFAPQQGGTT